MKIIKKIMAKHYMTEWEGTRNIFTNTMRQVNFPRMSGCSQHWFIFGRARSTNQNLDMDFYDAIDRTIADYDRLHSLDVLIYRRIFHPYKYTYEQGLKLILQGRHMFVNEKYHAIHPHACHFLVHFSAYSLGLANKKYSIEEFASYAHGGDIRGITERDIEFGHDVVNYALEMWDLCYDTPDYFLQHFVPSIDDSINYLEGLEKTFDDLSDKKAKLINLQMKK